MTEASGLAGADSGSAIGALATSTVWIALLTALSWSAMVYGTSITPEKSSFGTRMILPSAATTTEPFGTAMDCAVPGVNGTPLISITVRGSPSGSASLASRAIATGVSKPVVVVSSTASGPGFTGWIVIVVAIVPPLLSVTLKGMTVSPTLSTVGMKVISLVAGLNVAPAGSESGMIVNGSPLGSGR